MKEQLSEFKDEYQGSIKKKKAKSSSRTTKLDVHSGAIDESGASIKRKKKKDKRTKQSSRDVQNHSSSLLADSDGRNFQNEWSESSASFRPTRMSPTNKNMQFNCDNQPNDNYLRGNQKKDFDADLFSSSLTPVSRKARRVSDPESILASTINRPRDNKASIFDDLASFAEASLGTTVDGVSDVISFAETMSTNRNVADNVSHELLVGYMISTGIPRQEAENLAFAFTSIHNVNSQRAKHRPVSSSREFSVPLSPLSPHPNNPARSASTNKLDIIRGLDSSRNSSVRSVIRDDISVTSASSVRAPRNYVRAESPGAVEMEGRAFGAPYRHTSQRSVITDGAVVLGVDMGVDILVEAHPVEKEVESPIVYAESSPLPIQILCSKGPVRRTVSFVVLFISVVVGIMCYLLLRKESSASTLTESASPSLAPTYIADAIYDLAIEVSGKVALENMDSPQLRAVGWLSSRDTMSYQRYDKFLIQRYALVTFYFATNGNNWIDPENWLNPQSHECEWSIGIHCSLDESNQSIVDELDLSQNGLTGFLPLELGLLTDLTSLMLPKNNINGTIPQVILEIRKLSNIDLSSNLFFGKLPTSFGSLDSLDTLILADNDLTGDLPSSLYGLPLLRILDLSANALNGEIESRIQEWVNLVTLDLSNNRFNGKLPGNVSSFHKLDFLFLNNNQFTGSIPSLEAGLARVREISLSSNLLTGSFPTIKFDSDPLILELDLSDNLLSGTLRSELSSLLSLKTFDIGNNFFESTLPSQIAELTKLENFVSTNNLLTGTIVSMFSETLRIFDIADNMLQGTIPTNICNLSNLELLSMNHNHLEGTLPSCMSTMVKLKVIEISGAHISGSIPNDLMQVLEISRLNLSNNTLTGTVPSSIGELKFLDQLLLNDNLLSSSIPSSLGKLQLLRDLDLSNNQLSGTIPQTMGSLINLKSIALEGNMLTGRVPDGLCRISSLSMAIDMFGCNVDCSCCTDAKSICS